jgi:hypothetical protein
MKKNAPKRMLIITAIMMMLTAFSFTRLTGIDTLRPIHVITLLACGMSMGAFIVNLVVVLKNKNNR